VFLISEVVGQKGVYSFLNRMYEIRDVVGASDLDQLIIEGNISQNLFSDLTNCGLFIGTPQGFYISSLGKKVTLLLRGINGDSDISELFYQLSYLYPELRPYELITENITDYFIDSIERQPDFIRIYICSPWIRLDETHLRKVQSAVLKASSQYRNLQILIITKPKEGYRNWKASAETFKVLRSLGAGIMTHNKLHTKLYISEPGPYGGGHYAILGSENLTGRKNIELAIKIENDNEILRKLNQYFYEIWQESQILKEV
jgi:hypothetical protein